MADIQLIRRRDRIQQVIELFEIQTCYHSLDEVHTAFIVTFDEIEMSAHKRNSTLRVDPLDAMETIYMSVPPLIQCKTHTDIYFAFATKHIILFSAWGAVALYRKIEGVYDAINLYKSACPSMLLLSKPGACGKNVWGEIVKPQNTTI